MFELLLPAGLVEEIFDPSNVLMFIAAIIPIAGMGILVYDQLQREEAISVQIVHWSIGLLLMSTIVIMGVKGRLDDPIGTGLIAMLMGFVLGQMSNLDR